MLRFTPVPSEVPWYRWPKAVYQIAREEALARGEELPDELPLYNTPDEAIPRLYTERTVDVPKRLLEAGCPRQERREWFQTPVDDSRQEDLPRLEDAVTGSLGNVDEAFVLSLNDAGRTMMEHLGASSSQDEPGSLWTLTRSNPNYSWRP